MAKFQKGDRVRYSEKGHRRKLRGQEGVVTYVYRDRSGVDIRFGDEERTFHRSSFHTLTNLTERDE